MSDRKVYIIAEAGVNHNGEIEKAIQLAETASHCGADAVKFQVFNTELNVSKLSRLADYQKKAGVEETGQYEMLKKLELSEDEIRALKSKCDELQVDFFATPDDEFSINLLCELEVKYIKIASAELNNLPFLSVIGNTRRPVILSTGMGTLKEVKMAIQTLKRTGCEDITVLHCTSNYPVEPDSVNIRAITTLKEALILPVGYSDHTRGNEAAVMAVALGAVMVEKHLTLDKNLPGPDHQASADPAEFKDYVKNIRKAEMMLGDGIKKPQETELGMIESMRRSIMSRYSLSAGSELREEDLIFKRPGGGISPKDIDLVVGKRLKNDIRADELVRWDDLA